MAAKDSTGNVGVGYVLNDETVYSDTVLEYPPAGTTTWTADTTYHPLEGFKSGDYHVWSDILNYEPRSTYGAFEMFNGTSGNGWVGSYSTRHIPTHPLMVEYGGWLYNWGIPGNVYIKLPTPIILTSYTFTRRTYAGGWRVYGTNDLNVDTDGTSYYTVTATWTEVSDQSSAPSSTPISVDIPPGNEGFN
eukprot:6479377-Pyramimonas_sp.AAC.1